MFLYLVALPLFVHPLVKSITQGKRLSALLAGLSILLLILAGNIVHFLIASTLLFMWLIAHKLWEKKNNFINITFLVSAIVLALIVLFPPVARIIGSTADPFLPIMKLIILSLTSVIALLLTYFLCKKTKLGERVKWLTLVGVFLGLLLVGLITYKGLLQSPDPDWLAIQQRAEELVPEDGQVLVPPGLYGFRIESGRAIFADWKDGTLGNFDPVFAVEWWKRMQMLGVNSAEEARELGETGYGELSAEQVLSLGNRTGVSYIVALAGSLGESGLQGEVKKLAREGKYSLYKLMPDIVGVR
jgi:uncharacterized membrane protein